MASAVRRAGGTFLRQPALPPGLPCMIAKACGLEKKRSAPKGVGWKTTLGARARRARARRARAPGGAAPTHTLLKQPYGFMRKTKSNAEHHCTPS